MIVASLAFSLFAASAIWLAGRRDPARDARLTSSALLCLLALPLSAHLPKLAVMPIASAAADVAGRHPWALAAVWTAGTLVMMARLVMACVRLQSWRKNSRLDHVIRSGETGGMRIELRILDVLRSPVAAGVFRPVIYLPQDWGRKPEAVRRAVLLHEIGHHRRRDPLWRMIASAACALHWWNPLVWWMARRLAEQCEYACDAAVLAGGFRAGDYAHMLCDLASGAAVPPPALAMASVTGLESRVRRLASASTPVGVGKVGVVWIVFILLAGVSLALLGPASAPAFSRQSTVPHEEVVMRWSANPFPGDR